MHLDGGSEPTAFASSRTCSVCEHVRAQAGATCLHAAKPSVAGKHSCPRTSQGVTHFPVAYKTQAGEQVDKGRLSQRLLSRLYADVFPKEGSVILPPCTRQSGALNRGCEDGIWESVDMHGGEKLSLHFH